MKKVIYTKLRAREEKIEDLSIAQTPPDKWPSKPLVVAIFSIFNEDTNHSLPDWAVRKIKDPDKQLTEHFVEDAWIRVAERKELDKLLEEKDLELSDFSFGDQKDLFSRFLYARVMQNSKKDFGLRLCLSFQIEVKIDESFISPIIQASQNLCHK